MIFFFTFYLIIGSRYIIEADADSSNIHPCFDVSHCIVKLRGKEDDHFQSFAYEFDNTKYYTCSKQDGKIYNLGCVQCPFGSAYSESTKLCLPSVPVVTKPSPTTPTPTTQAPQATIPYSRSHPCFDNALCEGKINGTVDHYHEYFPYLPAGYTMYYVCAREWGKVVNRGCLQCPVTTKFSKRRKSCVVDAEIDGVFSDWVYDPCSVTCGGGVRTKRRTCNNPAPANGGKPCDGKSQVLETCWSTPCPSICKSLNGITYGADLDSISASSKKECIDTCSARNVTGTAMDLVNGLFSSCQCLDNPYGSISKTQSCTIRKNDQIPDEYECQLVGGYIDNNIGEKYIPNKNTADKCIKSCIDLKVSGEDINGVELYSNDDRVTDCYCVSEFRGTLYYYEDCHFE